jgi:small GTP-binding protein
VGKTSILRRLVEGTFGQGYCECIGVEFRTCTIEFDDKSVKLQIWRTKGQERFRTVPKAYLRNAVGVILVFDLTNKKSFNDLSIWLNKVRKFCVPDASVTLVGNKSDLVDQRVVSQDEAENFAQENQLQYLETSAREDQNIQEAFRITAMDVYHSFQLDPDDDKRFTENREVQG